MFIKNSKNPIIKRTPGSFYSIHAANPDVLMYKDKIFLYFRGQGREFHDQIGVAYVSPIEFDGENWDLYKNNPVIKVSEDKALFDSRHILDPAAVVFKNKVYLFYSGHSNSKAPGIGLAISENGFDFIKVRQIIENAIAPEIVLHDGELHLFYQRKVGKYFQFYKCISADGINFDSKDEVVVFSPDSKINQFDSFSITTCRIFKDNDSYYMTYSGCRRFDDYPESFGIAESTDLLNWKKLPQNPILLRGKEGEWDEGAIWFPTVYKHNDIYYLWYEGSGAGLGTDSKEAVRASKICRDIDYGGYADINFSQIGLATYKGNL